MGKDKAKELDMFPFFSVIREMEDKLRAEAGELAAAMRPKLEASERELADATARHDREAPILEKMKAEYRQLTAELEGPTAAEIETRNATAKDLKGGRISATEFYRKGLSDAAAAEQTRETIAGKLAELRKAIREKGREVLGLRVAMLEARQGVFYCQTFPGANYLNRWKEAVAELDRKAAPEILSGFPYNMNELHSVKQTIRESQGIAGWSWELDLAALRDLRIDPRIPEKMIEELEKAIATAEQSGAERFQLRYQAFGNEFSLVVRPDLPYKVKVQP